MAVLYRVNCGNTYPASGWEADDAYLVQGIDIYAGANAQDNSAVPECPADVLRDHRWATALDDPLTYEFDVSGYDEVDVSLYFAESYHDATGPGWRYFDIYINGVQVADDYDAWDEAGARDKGSKLALPGVDATSGTLTIQIYRQQRGPMVSGIIVEGELPGTTHNLSGTMAGDSSWSGVLTVDTPTPLPPAPSGGPVDNLALSVTIDGRNASLELDPDRFAIQSVLGRAVDTAKLWLVNPAVEPDLWQEVVISDATLLRLFGGYITHLSWRDGPDGGRIVEVTASDYGILLTKVQNVKREFENTTDAEMLGTLFQEHLPDFDVATYTYALLNYERKRFNRVSLDAVLDDLAEAAGATWYVDAYKNLHYFASEEARAPYGLSDTPDWEATYPAENLVVDAEGAGVINRVEVVGGSYLSEDATFYLPGTGEDTRVSLPFRLHAPSGQTAIQVWRNDGTQAVPVWTALTVKAGYLDELAGANDVLYYYSEGVLEQQSNWPDLPNALKVTGRYDVPLRARLRNEASYELYGRWFDGVLVNEDIIDKQTAKLAGKGYLAERAFGATSISCDVRQPGLRSGMTIHLADGLHGLDGDYLIQSCTATIGIGGAVVYGLELGAYDADLIDMIVRIARQARPKAAWREDEVLDDIFTEQEALPLAETAGLATSESPYYYKECDYGFSTWG